MESPVNIVRKKSSGLRVNARPKCIKLVYWRLSLQCPLPSQRTAFRAMVFLLPNRSRPNQRVNVPFWLSSIVMRVRKGLSYYPWIEFTPLHIPTLNCGMMLCIGSFFPFLKKPNTTRRGKEIISHWNKERDTLEWNQDQLHTIDSHSAQFQTI